MVPQGMGFECSAIRQHGRSTHRAIGIAWKAIGWFATADRDRGLPPSGMPSQSGLCNSCRHRDEHAQLAHRVGSPLLLLGSHRLRNSVYGGLAVSSFARVEHPDDRHPDERCRAVPEVTVAIARAVACWRRSTGRSGRPASEVSGATDDGDVRRRWLVKTTCAGCFSMWEQQSNLASNSLAMPLL